MGEFIRESLEKALKSNPAGLLDDPFLSDEEISGWSGSYTSAKINAEFQDEIIGGKLLVWAPDWDQVFPSSFGEDGLLFTSDDPISAIPAGWPLGM